MGVDLRNKLFFNLDNASFLNIKSEFFDINIMSAHMVYYLKNNVKLYFTHENEFSLNIIHLIILRLFSFNHNAEIKQCCT